MKIQDMKFDINSMCKFEEVTGRSLIGVLGETSTIKVSDLRALVYAGLDLTDIDKAGDLLMEYLKVEENEPILDVINRKFEETGLMSTKKKD